MAHVPAGQSYYGRVNGAWTIAIYLGMKHMQDGSKIYLLATPADEGEEGVHAVRDAHSGTRLWARVLALPRLNLARSPRSSAPHCEWPQGMSPRLDDLQRLMDDPQAIPWSEVQGTRRVIMSEAEDGGDEGGEGHENEDPPAYRALDPTSAAAPPTDNAALVEALQGVVATIGALGVRMDQMERRSAPVQAMHPQPMGTGVFDRTDTWGPTPAEDTALLSRLQGQRPGGTFPQAGLGAPSAPPPVHRAVGSGPRTAPGPQVENGPEALMCRGIVALEALAQKTDMAHHADPWGQKSFKLNGAQGRLQQDLLNAEFESRPAGVVREFEQCVTRLRPLGPGQTRPSDVDMLGAWREHVPLREHPLALKVGEAVMDAFLAIRRGEVDKGQARLALLMGALEQHTLDNGKWNARAETLLGMCPAPSHLYHVATADQKPSAESTKKGRPLGPLGLFVHPRRATTALAVWKDNHGGD